METFPLSPLLALLDLVEHEGRDLGEVLRSEGTASGYAVLARRSGNPPAHEALMAWTREAARRYRSLFASFGERVHGAAEALRPVEHEWIRISQLSSPTPEGVRRYELCAWGRRYVTDDGRHRELWIPAPPKGRTTPRTEAQIAIDAYVLATGVPAQLPSPHNWQAPARRILDPCPDFRPPETIRVVEVDWSEEEPRVLFEGDTATAVEYYRHHGAPTLRQTVNGQGYRSGPECAGCRLRLRCPGLPPVDGLLGLTAGAHPTRTWSATTGRAYRSCPGQEHIHSLRLPRTTGPGIAEALGRAAHAWLEERHTEDPQRACLPDDLVTNPVERYAARFRLPEEKIADLSGLVAAHLSVCPLDRHDNPDAPPRVEATLGCYDRTADIILIAKPDLLYQERGAWIWRETKTTAKPWDSTGDLFDRYPQLALALLLLHSNVLGGDRGRSRIELEILHPTGPDIELRTPCHEENVERARTVLRSMLDGWQHDTRFTPRPGKQVCRRCDVRRWCPADPEPQLPPSRDGQEEG